MSINLISLSGVSIKFVNIKFGFFLKNSRLFLINPFHQYISKNSFLSASISFHALTSVSNFAFIVELSRSSNDNNLHVQNSCLTKYHLGDDISVSISVFGMAFHRYFL